MIKILTIFVFSLIAVTSVFANSAAEFINASETKLDNPHDLKLSPDGRYLFVSDVGNDRVVILDPETLAYIDAFGSDHQGGTHDVDFDSEGQVYIADTHNNRVTIYEMTGTDAQLIGELNERIRGPEGVLVHPNGRIYVAGAWSNNLVAYENGEIVNELKGLSSPHDVELDPNGNIWLSDSGNNRMILLSPELKAITEWSDFSFDFDGVRYQDVLADGTVIAADKNNHQVKVIDKTGKRLLTLGTGKAGLGSNKFRTPEGIETLGDTLWVSDSGNNRIVKYKLKLNPQAQ